MLWGIHNHDLAPKLSGHLLAGRLKMEEKQRVIDMTKSLAAPRNILTNLKGKNKESVTLIKQVYNARTRWSCNTWFQSWRSINRSISQEQIARKPLLKTYSLLIQIQLICLTLFQPFWSWTPLTKPIPIECRYLRLLVSPLPKWRIRLRLPFFPLNKRITSIGHLRCWMVFWPQNSTCLMWLSSIGTPLWWKSLSMFSLKYTIYFSIFILKRMSNQGASRIVESKSSLQVQKLLIKMRRKRMMTSIVSLLRK